MRKLTILGAVALALLLSGPVLAGTRDVVQKMNMPPESGWYSRNDLFPDKPTVPLPVPVSAAEFDVTGSTVQPHSGPISRGLATLEPTSSGALISPRNGRALYSPQMRAEREIKRVIRRIG